MMVTDPKLQVCDVFCVSLSLSVIAYPSKRKKKKEAKSQKYDPTLP